jgi:hypothetical protein
LSLRQQTVALLAEVIPKLKAMAERHAAEYPRRRRNHAEEVRRCPMNRPMTLALATPLAIVLAYGSACGGKFVLDAVGTEGAHTGGTGGSATSTAAGGLGTGGAPDAIARCVNDCNQVIACRTNIIDCSQWCAVILAVAEAAGCMSELNAFYACTSVNPRRAKRMSRARTWARPRRRV